MTARSGSPRGAEVSEALISACSSGDMVGGAIGLIHNGTVITTTVAGATRIDGPSVHTTSPFGVGSITKLLTAIAVARSKSLSFDSLVAGLLPGIEFDDSAAFDRVTVAHLLGHTSGLPFLARDEGPGDDGSVESFVREDLAHHRFHSRPGDLALYTPSPYSIVGRLLEIETERPFHALLRDLVLDPAGMATAVFPGDAPQALGLTDNASQYPSGFLLASLEDLVRLAKALIEGWFLDEVSWQRIGSSRSSRDISHIGYPLARISSGYGLGAQVGSWGSSRVVRHPGRQWSYHCTLDLIPESGSAVVLLTNGARDGTFNELLNLSYEAIAGRAPLPAEPGLESVTDELKSAWVGTYVHPSRGITAHIEVEDGDLVYRSGEIAAPIYHVGGGRVVVPMSYGSAPLWFPESEGPARYVKIWGEPLFRETLETWSPVSASDFDGVYHDTFWPMPSTDIRIHSTRGQWVIERGGDTSSAMVLGERRLATEYGVIQFNPSGDQIQIGDAARYSRS